jgi:hypothetical protein
MRFTGAVVPGERALAQSRLFTAVVRIDAGGRVISKALGDDVSGMAETTAGS